MVTFGDWASQEITLYEDGEYVEVEWTVGPINVNEGVGKEVILRYDTNIQSAGKFYTDANGRELLERTRNSRPTWSYTVTEPVSGNYYPVNSRIYVKDATRQLTVLTGKTSANILNVFPTHFGFIRYFVCLDRSQGGSSMLDGSVELMVHRRLLHDDRRGVGEPLNETAYGDGLVVRGRHILILESPDTSALYHRTASQRFFMHPLSTYSLVQQSYAEYSAAYRQTWSAVLDTLPLNVHLLTLDQQAAKDYLVRVENYFELFEDATYSRTATIDLQSLFVNIGNITNAVELTLAANYEAASLQRLNWITSNEESTSVPSGGTFFSSSMSSFLLSLLVMFYLDEPSVKDTSVKLNPMQIRTFEVTVA